VLVVEGCHRGANKISSRKGNLRVVEEEEEEEEKEEEEEDQHLVNCVSTSTPGPLSLVDSLLAKTVGVLSCHHHKLLCAKL